MKIDNFAIQLSASNISVERHTIRESLQVWQGNPRPEFEAPRPANTALSAVVILSDKARAVQATDDAQQIREGIDEASKDPRIMLLMRMLEALTGKKIKLLNLRNLHADNKAQQLQQNTAHAAQAQPANAPQGWGLEYRRSESHYEAEQSNFSAQGVINTADGQEIRFDLQLSMQREFSSQSNVSILAGDAMRKDPLVINFSGTAAQLTDTRFAFDIDSDGTQDNISFVGPGSGFLALDTNSNGKIDNGSELFGAQSGNGFADLAKYDSDGNHWIDQNDTIYDLLRVWARDAAGNDSLTTLQASNAGALYLGSVATPFSIKDAENTLQGQVRASGIYLNENGTAGTLQQVDLMA